MLRNEKQSFVEEMKRDVERAAGILFLDYTGLTVEEADKLRRKVREASLSYKVVKNTLMARALAGTSCEDAAQYLKGTPTGVVIGFEDPVSAAKLTYDFLKECQHLKVKGGVVDKRSINSAQAEALSKMPNKRAVQASVIAQVLSPASNLIRQFKSPAGRIVGAVEKLVDKLDEKPDEKPEDTK